MSEIPKSPIRIVLVDDSELVRRGIKAVLANQIDPPMCVVGEAGTVASALLYLSLLFCCVHLQATEIAQKATKRTKSRASPPPSFASLPYVQRIGVRLRLRRPGISVCLLHKPDIVLLDIQLPDGSGFDVCRRIMMRAEAGTEYATDLAALSAQERRVLALVAEGLTNKQISEQLGLTESTVKNYLVNVFEKLQVKRRGQAAAIYFQQASPAKP